MLVLTRFIGETIRIGDDVSLTVLGSKGNQVRIGVNAPKEVEVHREEIYRRIQQERSGVKTEAPNRPTPRPSSQSNHGNSSTGNNYQSKPAPGNSYDSNESSNYYSMDGQPQKRTKSPKVIVKRKFASLME